MVAFSFFELLHENEPMSHIFAVSCQSKQWAGEIRLRDIVPMQHSYLHLKRWRAICKFVAGLVDSVFGVYRSSSRTRGTRWHTTCQTESYPRL